MKHKRIILPERRRKIPAHFSWIDHRLVRDGYSRKCSARALGLYLFLLSVSDSEGLSFYGVRSISREININGNELDELRRELLDAGLVAYRDGIYQVLDLGGVNKVKPDSPVYDGSKKVSEILEQMFAEDKR